ncbi:MAG: hypothetical protein M3010_00610 [Candidatus Dormibacteraeota bacterium]|nr:hypothetical protein [Candidatus Dormibacteraeota bacterium]
MSEERADRVDRLQDDVQDLHVPEPSADREAMLLRVGVALPVLGLLLIGVAWFRASGTALVADQIPILISGALVGLGLILAGVAIWIRFSVARLLRVWLARDLIERQRQTDQLIAALTGDDRSSAAGAKATVSD